MTHDPLTDGRALEAGWSNEPGVWVDGEKTGDYHEADDEGEALAPEVVESGLPEKGDVGRGPARPAPCDSTLASRLDALYDERFFDDPEHRDVALDGPGPGAPEWQWDEYLA